MRLEVLGRRRYAGRRAGLRMPSASHEAGAYVMEAESTPYGSHRLSAVSAIGMSFPLHCSANGKALLAALNEAQLERVKRHIDFTSHTVNTITSWKKLAAELDTIRREGIAYDREEHSAGISAVAAVVRGPAGELAAISIPTPTQRFKGMEARLKNRLKACCVEVQQMLGPS